MAGITIVGLGPGDPALLTREAWDALSRASEVYLRTARHPTVDGLPQGPAVHSFDAAYESTPDFEAVYAAIVERVLALGRRPEGVVYAVPGNPLVGESTVTQLLARARQAGLPMRVVAGLSFVEPTLALLEQDALPGLFVADALELAGRHHPPFPPDSPALVAQLYSAALASDVKLTLMNQYPDTHPVQLVHAAGTPDAAVEAMALYEIDRSAEIAHLTSLFVPPLPRPSALESFQEVIAHLRAPDGCPWDREQTHRSLRSNLLEEAHEVLAAIDADDPEAMREEFGDLLLQVVLQSQIATEHGEFSMADVMAGIHAKIVRRHPHVFGEVRVDGVEHVLKNWEALKAEEREEAGKTGPDAGVLGSVPKGLPALAQAETYQRRAARVGFDWPDVGGVLAKIKEEIDEVTSAEDDEHRAAEIGDLLFAVVNYARWLDVEAESALREANARFFQRFRRVENAARDQRRPLGDMSLAELDDLWEAAKREGG